MTGRARSAIDAINHQSMIAHGARYSSVRKLAENCPDNIFEQELDALRMKLGDQEFTDQMRETDKFHNGMLQIAVRRHLVHGVAALIEHGAIVVNEFDNELKLSPVIEQVLQQKNLPVEILKTLLEAGMDPNIAPNNRVYALSWFREREECLFVLFDYGADIAKCMAFHNLMATHMKNQIFAAHQRWIAAREPALKDLPAKRPGRSL